MKTTQEIRPMLKALIPVERTLSSSIALRYACRKSGLLGLRLQPIHVEEPDTKPHSAQSGWIRRTWESGLKQAGLENVRRILNGEDLGGYPFPSPIVTVGDQGDEILHELQRGGYDLFIDGAVSNFNQGEFRKLLRSRLYKRMPCPALMVKNLIMSDRVALLVDTTTPLAPLVEQFVSFFPDISSFVFDVCIYEPEGLQQGSHAEAMLENILSLLRERNLAPDQTCILRSMPESAAEEFREYGLLAAMVDRTVSCKAPLTEILGRVACPLLLCW